MVVEEQQEKYQLLTEWFNTDQGVRLANAFATELSRYQETIYGNTLLQLGSFGNNSWINSLRFVRKWFATPDYNASLSSIATSFNKLPIDRNSLDCIIAPFCNEVFKKEESPILEMDRILKPMGHVIYFGINPWSFWGAAIRWGEIDCFSHITANLISSFKIKRILCNLGYSQRAHTSFYYIPPVKNERVVSKLEFFNEIGKMLWPFPAGFYCLILQKKQNCLTGLSLQAEKDLILGEKSSSTVPINRA